MIVFGLTAKSRKFEFRAVIPVIIRKPHILHMNLRTDIIIHAFAFLHLAVALGCRLADINDEIMLTLLSVLMVTLLCVKMNARMEIIVSSIILTNVAGYVLGVYGAKLVGLLSGSALLTHSVSTFMTTEVIGWCTFLLLKAVSYKHFEERLDLAFSYRKGLIQAVFNGIDAMMLGIALGLLGVMAWSTCAVMFVLTFIAIHTALWIGYYRGAACQRGMMFLSCLAYYAATLWILLPL